MKEIKCQSCGSNDFVTQGEMYVCQACGAKYSPADTTKLVIELDVSKQVQNLYILARRELDLHHYLKAKTFYDQILVEKPEDWEALLYSLIGDVYSSNSGSGEEIFNATVRIADEIHILMNAAVNNTDDAKKRLVFLNWIVNEVLLALECLDKVSTRTGVNFTAQITNLALCATRMAEMVKNAGKQGLVGDASEYNKVAAKALRWRNSWAVNATAVFDEEKRHKFVEELAEIDPTYVKPEVPKSSGCYVATAVYGSYDCPEVWTLRRWRDYNLAATWYGRAFIRTYYAISPTIVKWFGHTKWFNLMWKGKLDRMVEKLQSQGVESTPYEDLPWYNKRK